MRSCRWCRPCCGRRRRRTPPPTCCPTSSLTPPATPQPCAGRRDVRRRAGLPPAALRRLHPQRGRRPARDPRLQPRERPDVGHRPADLPRSDSHLLRRSQPAPARSTSRTPTATTTGTSRARPGSRSGTRPATAEVAPGAKVGFCLQDVERIDNFGPGSRVYSRAATEYCKPGTAERLAACSRGSRRAGRTSTPPSTAVPVGERHRHDAGPLPDRASRSTPDDFVRESNETEQRAHPGRRGRHLPGYAACRRRGTTGAHDDHARRAAFRPSGPAVFAIDSGPAHGTLTSLPARRWARPQVVYTPNPGFAGRTPSRSRS